MNVELKYKNDIFIWTGGYDTKDYPKSAGFRWNPNKKRWETKDPETAAKLKKFADKETAALFDVTKNHREENLRLSKSINHPSSFKAPNGFDYYGYQKAGIAYGLKNKMTYIADEMGLGKTIQAIGLINELNPNKTIIISPASLKYNWKKELETWMVHDKKIAIINSNKKIDLDADIIIINYAILWRKKMKVIIESSYDLLIADEVHYAKNNKTKRSKAFYNVKADRKVYLSGTPLDKPIDLYYILRSLGFDMNWKRFVETYCDGYKGDFGWVTNGASNLKELQTILRSRFMVRRLKSEVLTELPAKQRSIISLDPDNYKNYLKAERKVMSDLDIDNLSYEEKVDKMRQYSADNIGEIAKARHDLAVAKVDDVIAIADDDLESTDKVVIFAHHKDVIDKIMEHYGDAAVKVVGGLSEEVKNTAVERFQNDNSVKVFVGNFVAAGVGLTLTASNHVIFAELDWRPSMISQSEDRCHRIGQKDTVIVKHVVVDGSIDSMIAKTIIKKQKISDATLSHTELDDDVEVFKSKEVDYDSIAEKAAKEKAIRDAEKAEREANRQKRLTENVKIYSDEEKSELIRKLRILSLFCDGARAEDGRGFNKFDTHFGKSLASKDVLTDIQAKHAERLVSKYRRQLS